MTAAVSPYRVAASVAAAGLLLGGCAFWGSGDGAGDSTDPILQNPDVGEDEPIVEVVVAPVPGVSDDEIRFGQSAAFSGPAGELGTNMRIGIEAAFRRGEPGGRGTRPTVGSGVGRRCLRAGGGDREHAKAHRN